MGIEGKLQVVTGGTSGMGLGLAKELGKFGPVLIGGRSEKRLAAALEELKAAGVEAYGKPCDVSSKESVEAFVEYAVSLGEIGGVANAAGVDWDKVPDETLIEINMRGVTFVTEAFLPYIDNGVMMHFSSITGYFYQPYAEDYAVWNNPNDPDFTAKWMKAVQVNEHPKPDFLTYSYNYYAGSKRFVMHYVQANASRFGAKNARIFSVAPGSFMTPMLESGVGNDPRTVARTAFKRFGTVEEMACLISQLMGPGHDYLTGCDIIHDGGKTAMSLVPQLA